MMHTSTHDQEVQEFLGPRLLTVRVDDPVSKMLETMDDEGVSALPVVDDAGTCLGLVSMTDMLHCVVATEKTLQSEYPHFDDCLWAVDMVQARFGDDKVSQVMSEVLATVTPDTSMRDAAKIMLGNHVHHLPVVTSHGQLVGMLSSLDFVRLAAGTKR